MISFNDFFLLHENQDREGGKPIPTPINLASKDNDFKPFLVKKDPSESVNSNLSDVIEAFKKEVKLHKTIKNGKTEWSTLPKKKLYLVGGAVRDHLMGKTPKDLDLATDATPDEIRIILKNAGFQETKAQGGNEKKQNSDLPMKAEPASKDKIFYAKGWDQKGNEFVFGIKINGQEFELATFREDSKASDGRTPEEMKFSDMHGDASRRDFDINSMYIELDNPDGPNNKLTDMFGGAHSLARKEVKWVGKAEDRLNEDFLRALRYIRMVSRYGDPKTVPAEELKKIEHVVPQIIKKISKERIREEFLKGLENKDVDPVEYIKLYKKSGLLPAVFPNMIFEMDSADHFSDERFRPLAIAWILRKNDPNSVVNMLKAMKWTSVEIRDIAFLLSVLHLSPENVSDLKKIFLSSSFNTDRGMEKLKKWWQGMHKKDPNEMKAFLAHAKTPMLSAKIIDPSGIETWNPELGPIARKEDVGKRIKDIEKDRFKKLLGEKS